MKISLDQLEVTELGKKEQLETNGGIAIIAASVLGFAVGAGIGLLVKWYKNR